MARAPQAPPPEVRCVKVAGCLKLQIAVSVPPSQAFYQWRPPVAAPSPPMPRPFGPRYGFCIRNWEQLLDPEPFLELSPLMKFIALIHPTNVGCAYGIGRTVCEAQSNAATSGFHLGDWVAVEISRKAYEAICLHGPQAVHLGLPPHPGTPEDSSRHHYAGEETGRQRGWVGNRPPAPSYSCA